MRFKFFLPPGMSFVVMGFLLSLSMSSLPVMAAEAGPEVVLETSLGPVTIALDRTNAPRTVANFVEYVQAGFYDGTIFHRVIPDFMIQGGGFTPDMREQKTRPPIPNEADNGLANRRGTIAMARTPDPHSASAQFFINLKDNFFLDHREKTRQGWGYCVFGRVTEGMAVVDAIAGRPTHTVGRYQNVPQQPIIIKKAVVVRKEAASAGE